MDTRIDVIGVGSPFGDDRLGWVAAEALQRSPSLARALESGRIVISILDRPGAMLLAHWRGAGTVIVLDAVRSGAAPGTRHCLDANDLAAHQVAPASSHTFGVAQSIELGRILGQLPARLWLRGVEPDPACSGFCLSEAVAQALPAFTREVEAEVQALLLSAVLPRSRSA